MMKRFMSVVWLLTLVGWITFPCQVLATRITPTTAEIGPGSVASGGYSTAMGYSTTASGNFSTAMGDTTIASGDGSTAVGLSTIASGEGSTAMGAFTTAGGIHSWAGGFRMQLTSDAHNTFVWGNGGFSGVVPIDKPNAFLIFPAGEVGMVGIGTKDPERIMHIVGVNPRILIEASSSNAEINFKNSGDSGSAVWSVYKDGSNHNLNFYQGGNKVTIENATGNVGIGTTNPGYKLEVNGSAAKPGGGSWSNSSDERLKNITGEYTLGLDDVVRLRPVTFHYKEDNPRGLPSDEEYIGFIAQEVREVLPEAVSEGPDGYLDFNMHPVNVALVNAVKQLKAENEALREEIRQIKAALGM